MADMTEAAEIVNVLLEADGVDPKEFARSHDQHIEHYDPILIQGSYGTLTIDPNDGTVIRYEDAPEDPDEGDYSDIVKFNLQEFQQWLQQNAPEFADVVRPGGQFDIVNVGFWTDTGGYVAAEDEHRRITYLGAEP